MKQPDNGLWRIKSLKDNYLSFLFAAVLLLSSFCAHAQSYTTINGRFTYADSVKYAKLKNTQPLNTFLTTDTSGRLILKRFDTTSAVAQLATKQPLIPIGTITQYLRADLSIGSEMTGEIIPGSSAITITLANTPLTNTVKLFKNGVRLAPNLYAVLGAIITLTDTRKADDFFQSDYKF